MLKTAKTLTYNNQKVILLHHIKSNTGIDLYHNIEQRLKTLQLNKDFFIVPKEEMRKISKGYNNPNAVLFTHEGCKKLLYRYLKKNSGSISQSDVDYYLGKTFGTLKDKEPVIKIIEDSAIDILNIKKNLFEMSANTPLVQLIIEKAAEKVADRIIKQISA